MADSFADLWNTSAPVKPSQPPRKLGASPTPSSSSATIRPKYDAFSMLAASGSNSSSPRSLTPSYTAAAPLRGANSGASTTTSGDAFGDLLSGTFGAGSNNSKLTIAERAAKAKAQVIQQPVVPSQSTKTWAGLDSLAGTTSFSSSQPSKPKSSGTDDDWLFDSSTGSAPVGPSPPNPLADDWGLDDFVSGPKPSYEAPPVPSSRGKSLLDLDDFQSSSERDRGFSSSAPKHPPSRSDTPGDFDFGDRENALLDDDSGSEDDVLGGLGRPVQERPTERRTPPGTAPAHRTPSPPPHLIGQIVEMGFSPTQARVALASTESGLDVQVALETLLSQTSTATPNFVEPTTSGGSQRERNRFQDHDGWGDEEHTPRAPPQRPHHRSRPSQERPPSSSESNYQQQADKIIYQASEIGSHLFHRANAFWKEGKSKVQKAYEERAATRTGTTGQSQGERQSGRPRWMQEDPDQDQPNRYNERTQTNFRDHESDTPPSQPEPPTRVKMRPQAKPSPRDQPKTADLFGEDAFTAYVSPFRRGNGSNAAVPPPSSQTGPLRTPSPVRLSERQVVSASPSAISVSARHKASGTEMFKLGRFAEAETAYTSAISQLPESHLLLVPLLNNRALSRMRTGNVSGAIEDCTAVIAIIGRSYHPAREAKVTREEDGAGVDLGDGLVKAWRRRAEAYEGKEKWDLARQDWESIAGADFAGRQRSEASSGIGRCRRMLTADNASDGVAPSAPRANAPPRRATRPPPPPRRGPTPPSEALTRLKQADREAEAEEQARMELKDSVDSRLAAWKNGKETNLRALVASLDTVLWPELGWQKVGMAELVTPNQVKLRYTKAIAKVHPDKLNVKNTTVEQRMVANGVFGALNDAWNTFKP